MNRLITLIFLAALTSACASNGMMHGDDKMMMDDGMHKSMDKMEMKKDGMTDSMSHDSMMKKETM